MLSNYLLEEYFEKIKPEINLISSYLEDDLIKDIIIKCRLKPYKYNSKFNRKLVLKRHWVDEFGNSLILKGKKIKIIENDLSLDHSLIKKTDLYFGLTLDKITKISKILHLSYGKDEDFNNDCFVLTFLGIDNYFRTFSIYNGEVQKIPPLLIGINNLKKIIKNIDIKIYTEVNKKDYIVYPCSQWREWIISLPIQTIFWKESRIEKNMLNILGVK